MCANCASIYKLIESERNRALRKLEHKRQAKGGGGGGHGRGMTRESSYSRAGTPIGGNPIGGGEPGGGGGGAMLEEARQKALSAMSLLTKVRGERGGVMRQRDDRHEEKEEMALE